MSNPVRELLQDQPALASGVLLSPFQLRLLHTSNLFPLPGPHMAHIGRALTQMGFENIESARKICASIMDGSRVSLIFFSCITNIFFSLVSPIKKIIYLCKVQNSHVRATAQTLLEVGSSETDEVFTKRLER